MSFSLSGLSFVLTTHRHWSVFASGMAMVLILWVITPLQSSLLTIESVDRVIPTQFEPAAEFKTNRSKELDSDFFLESYYVTWLGQEIGAFMTKEFVTQPFVPQDYNSSYPTGYRGNVSWIAEVTGYQTHVDCTPANISAPGENGDDVYTFATDKCSHRINPLLGGAGPVTRNLMYIGHGSISNSGQDYLRKSNCPADNIFLGVWAKSQSTSARKVSGIFCKSSYSSSKVNITFDATSWSITNYSVIGEPKKLPTEHGIINITSFEQYLAKGAPESTDGRLVPTGVPSTHPRSSDWTLSSPVGPVEYALGLEDEPFDEFINCFSTTRYTPSLIGNLVNLGSPMSKGR